jgi:TPR repeat protein
MIYANGRGVSQNYTEALKWFRKSAAQGDADSQNVVSFQNNRQLSGWNPPPLVIRAFGAHGQEPT